ncbi:uncharacterized protein LOC108864195 [Galendromus occidentalis]|uniref:Uncharacterized protein LOC108864195 n=1 Tax=Galendromus occidentalis TaxID=34638 RepID=A0AAJ7P9M8_9ACAR|nr:uncharacterized protein LOC108864195 [Galendromus occidentalis]
MVFTKSTAALVLFCLVCVDAKIKTRFATGFHRMDRELQGAPSIWNGSLHSAALCLSACLKLSCQSLTYGESGCTLYATYLCHPEDRFHLSLVSAPGVNYFDLSSDSRKFHLMINKEACLMYGRCLEKCDEGSWTTTTTTTVHPQNDIGKHEGTFQNPVSHKHGSSSKVSNLHLSPTTTSPGMTALNHRPKAGEQNVVDKTSEVDNEKNPKPLGSEFAKKNNHDNTDNRLDTSTDESSFGAADNTGTTVSTSPTGPTLPPEKLGSGLLLIQSPMNFDDALAFCVKSNMTLAMPQNQKEHAILVKAMKRRSIVRMWIGVKKVTAGGTDAIYVDGRAVSRRLLLWGEGQPNNSRGGQICVEMNASLKYLWNDFDCLYRTAFVCR